MLEVSIGVMAYNEGLNISRLLRSIINQKLSKVFIKEIIVVASGCTDNTLEVVRNLCKKNNKLKIITQSKRLGKASAVNFFIKKAKSNILIMISADTIVKNNAIEKLILPFKNEILGMTAGHIIPINEPDGFIRYYVTTLWKLHHEVCKKSFKAGEMVAWRNIIKRIDPKTSVDETSIEAIILKNNFKTLYVEDSIVYNKGPENFWDFLKVRRRQIAGYYQLNKSLGFEYRPSTMSNWVVIKLFLTKTRSRNKKERFWKLGVLIIEGFARVVAFFDWFIFKNNYYIWPMAKSTKDLPKDSKIIN